MKESFPEILKGYFKQFLPLIVTLFLVLLSFVQIHFSFFYVFKPDFALMCLYFWTLYRSDLFGILSILFLGLVVDSLSGVPFGMNILVFIFAYLLTLAYGSYIHTKSFLMSWIAFAFISFLCFLFKWLLFSVYYKVFLNFGHVFVSCLATLLLYPLVACLNVYVQTCFLGDDEVIDEQR